jgi:hypothetical protein
VSVKCSYCYQHTDRPLYRLGSAGGNGSYGLFPLCIGCELEADVEAEPLTLALLADAARQAYEANPNDLLANHEALLRLAEAVRVFAAPDTDGEVA